MATTMLTEFMPKKSSTGVALNNLIRNICSCTGALVAAPLIESIGNGWLFTILAIVSLASASSLYAFKVYGPKWRIRMEKELK